MAGLSEFELVDLLEGRKSIDSISSDHHEEIMGQLKTVAEFLRLQEASPEEFTKVQVVAIAHPGIATLKFGFEYQGYSFPSFTLVVSFADEDLKVESMNYDGSPLGVHFGRKVFYVKRVAAMAFNAIRQEMESSLSGS